LLPIMFENINPIVDGVLIEVNSAACFIDNKPKIVIGQLLMKLAPTVTMKLGARIERTPGRVVVLGRTVIRGL
jgi:hypothetical protein